MKRGGRQPMRVWARVVLARRLSEVERHLDRVLHSSGTEAIHGLCVVAWRARAAVRHLEPCFGARAAQQLQAALRQLARQIGRARDLDLLIESLAGAAKRPGAPLAAVLPRLQRRRAERLRRALPQLRWLHRSLPGWSRRLAR